MAYWQFKLIVTYISSFFGVFRQMVLTVGLDHKNGTAAGARKSFKATVEVTLAVALPGERGEAPRLLRGVISASVLRGMLGSLRPKGRGSRHRRKRTGRGCKERRRASRLEGRRIHEKWSATAEEFSPMGGAPPLPKEPEPGAV